MNNRKPPEGPVGGSQAILDQIQARIRASLQDFVKRPNTEQTMLALEHQLRALLQHEVQARDLVKLRVAASDATTLTVEPGNLYTAVWLLGIRLLPTEIDAITQCLPNGGKRISFSSVTIEENAAGDVYRLGEDDDRGS